jgi:hypothetical protein
LPRPLDRQDGADEAVVGAEPATRRLMAEVVTAMPLQDRPAELADVPEAAIREYLDLAWVRYIDPSRRRPYGRQGPRSADATAPVR